jgi:mono/diheme cytochrome c family protein
MLTKLLIGIVATFIVIQFIPYGKNHINPSVQEEPKWNTPKTKELFMRACGDCHSNQTKWPLYSQIAPISWFVFSHVEEGREHLNISMWNIQKKQKGDEAAEEVEEGDMPLASYLIAHPEAKLNKQDKVLLIQGLKKTFGKKD